MFNGQSADIYPTGVRYLPRDICPPYISFSALLNFYQSSGPKLPQLPPQFSDLCRYFGSPVSKMPGWDPVHKGGNWE